MPLVRMDGTETGVSVRLPPGRGTSQAFPDGRGGVLVIDYAETSSTWVDVRPGGFQRDRRNAGRGRPDPVAGR